MAHSCSEIDTTTFLAGLRHDQITAPCVFDGPINGQRFLAWVEQALVPTLKPGDIVVMDSIRLPASAKPSRPKAARSPICRPDLNPIGQLFAKLKHLLRKTEARTVDALWTAIGQMLDQFNPEECKNYLANSGYGPPKRDTL